LDNKSGVGEIAALFFKLGVIGFGGPAAHIAMMEEEVVKKRGWMSQEQFLDLVGVTSIIPGPNSTEMAIHVGYLRGGILGLLVAGLCFIFPAVAITTVFAWLYMSFGAVPQVAWLLYGIKPAVLAVILGALWRLGSKALKGWRLTFLGLAVMLISLTEFSAVIALLGGGLLGMLWLRMSQREDGPGQALVALPLVGSTTSMLAGVAPLGGPSLVALGLFFLKIGAILYGSGYVLVAFLEEELVRQYAWMTQEQLLEAIAIGQFTPGPVLSTAAFIGYVVTGGKLSGALVAAGAIFLPSFVFVAALNPLLPKLRESAWVSAFLDAVNVCAVGLLAAVTLELGYLTLDDWPKYVIAVGAAILGLWRGVGAVWLVLGGAAVGWVFFALGF
jgi:chromate transporter